MKKSEKKRMKEKQRKRDKKLTWRSSEEALMQTKLKKVPETAERRVTVGEMRTKTTTTTYRGWDDDERHEDLHFRFSDVEQSLILDIFAAAPLRRRRVSVIVIARRRHRTEEDDKKRHGIKLSYHNIRQTIQWLKQPWAAIVDELVRIDTHGLSRAVRRPRKRYIGGCHVSHGESHGGKIL